MPPYGTIKNQRRINLRSPKGKQGTKWNNQSENKSQKEESNIEEAGKIKNPCASGHDAPARK